MSLRAQVFPAGSLTASDFETGVPTYALKGRLKSTAPTINPNTSIAHFTYDALGRLIAKQSPWPAIAGEIRTEIYLHDGVRRIQEIWRQPAQGNGSQGGQNQNNQGPPTYVDSTEREYVHSPGYVDELVAEIDTSGATDTFWWVLQDPNYNVVALVSDGDGAGGMGSGGTYRGEVARQYSWSPYGQLLRADIFDTSAPMSRLGHQGLFHDRLDADILTEPMVAFCDQLVQNRNRTVSPRLGRFLQRDPNATALGVLDSSAVHGNAVAAALADTDGDSLFGDGMSVYGYVGSNPLARVDPHGLVYVYNPLAGADAGGLIGAMLESMITTYADNMDYDADWASDWSLQDDWHTRGDSSWVEWSMMMGAFGHYFIEIPDEWVQQVFATAGPITRQVFRAGKLLRTGQLHHLLPKYLGRVVGKQSEVMARLPEDLHRAYHKYVDHWMRDKLGTPPMTTRRYKWDDWMRENTAKVGQVFDELVAASRQFESDHNLTGLVDGVMEAIK